MGEIIRFVGPENALEIFGIRMVGMTAATGKKVLLTIVFILLVLLVNRLLRQLSRWLLWGRHNARAGFWVRQGIRLLAAMFTICGLASIWFDDPARLTTAFGLVTAGLAFALQKLVTAIAGYFVILFSKTFNVGDRIRMGGVRGDVIALNFVQTTIMEMGQPPKETADDSNSWVQSRQYTGRVVTVSNANVFDEPVFNYTRDFPYIWEEIMIPIPFDADHDGAEQILLEAAARHSISMEDLTQQVLDEMTRRYFNASEEVKPRVFWRLTDNWVELTVRFMVRDHGIREVKDAMSREILKALQRAGIGIASGTYAVVGMPTLRIEGISLNGHSEQMTVNAVKPR